MDPEVIDKGFRQILAQVKEMKILALE